MGKTGLGAGINKMVYGKVIETGANTLTFAQIQSGYGVTDRMGWYIQRIEIRCNGIFQTNATSDGWMGAISTSNQLSTLDYGSAAIKIYMQESRVDFGTAASGQTRDGLNIRNFADIEGGGILVLPNPLYLGVLGISLTGPCQLEVRMFVKEVELSDNDWVQLVEQTRLLS